ncbi:MAG: alpha/beta hydrolase [bacterium]|nr:MAG: alpha/beta hydrolase [bacterium]
MKNFSDNQKPRLILLPGMPGTGRLFQPLMAALKDSFDLDAVSYPEKEPLGYDKLISAVTSRIPKEKPYFILGESFSGPLAVLAAARHPDNLLGVVLVASFVQNPMPGWISGLKRFARGPILNLRPRSHINDSLMGKKCSEITRSWVHETMPKLPRDVVSARVQAVLGVNVREELKSIQAPVLYLAGARDWLIGRKCIDTVWLCRPDVEIKVIEGVHMILQTNPDDSARAITDFCSRVIGSPKTKAQSPKGEQ